MDRFIISFYAPNEHGELKIIAVAEEYADHDYKAAALALKKLEDSHPEVRLNLWMAEGPARQ